MMKTPEATPTAQPRGAAKRPSAQTPQVSAAPRQGPSIAELTAATSRLHGRKVLTVRPRRPSLIIAVSAALVAGGAWLWFAPVWYVCTATFAMVGGPRSTQLGHLHEVMYAATAVSLQAQAGLQGRTDPQGQANTGSDRRQWSIHRTDESTLGLDLFSANRRAGLATLRRTAQHCLDAVDNAAQDLRLTPSATEIALSTRIKRLTQSAETLRQQVRSVEIDMPNIDPQESHDRLMARWKGLRAGFVASSEEAKHLDTQVSHLRAHPQPRHALVAATQREAAMNADRDLQQDLAELSVRLTELKLQLLEVWQNTSGLLENLQSIHHETSMIVSPDADNAGDERVVALLGTLNQAVARYGERLDDFASTWTGEFTAVNRLAVDPLSAELLDRYERLRSLLNEFLFLQGKTLASMRASLQEMRQGDNAGARLHVLHSNVARAVERLQLAHHRLEFKAGSIEAAQNFRLDAALLASRGLKQRSQARLRIIESRLEEKARTRATRERAQALVQGETRLTTVREQADLTVHELFKLQAELDLTESQSRAFLSAALTRELTNAHLEELLSDLSETKAHQAKLTSQRTAEAAAMHLTLKSCEASVHPRDARNRLFIAGFGALLTLLAVGLTQFWMARR